MIVHFINSSTFANGYIKFMREKFPQMEHCFFLRKDIYSNKLNLDHNIILYTKWNMFYTDSKIRRILYAADKIVISGFFDSIWLYFFQPQWFWNKTYIHFWGGDFYSFRGLKWNLSKIIHWICYKRSKAFIFLIHGEYEQMLKIFHIHKKNFIAPMPCENAKDYHEYYKEADFQPLKILVGNSATKENQHIEVYKMLSKFKNENIEVYSSLAYGDEVYKKEVINAGRRLLGDKFVPITEFTPYDEYLKILSDIDVGIFNNNRQQALGNIYLLIKMGKSVFLREDTSMWENFRKIGVEVWSVDKLNNITLKEMAYVTDEVRDNNVSQLLLDEKKQYSRWEKILALD